MRALAGPGEAGPGEASPSSLSPAHGTKGSAALCASPPRRGLLPSRQRGLGAHPAAQIAVFFERYLPLPGEEQRRPPRKAGQRQRVVDEIGGALQVLAKSRRVLMEQLPRLRQRLGVGIAHLQDVL